MQIIEVEKSPDLCAESGWFAYYIHFDGPVAVAFIENLVPLGELIFLKHLKTPFFTLRSESFLIKGLAGDSKVKIGIEPGRPEQLDSILDFLREILK
ncbi:hypothetical protein [Breznakiella homolactica]|uniref:Uncharacterized protein n=1 Tax=Breznakiella homolactica TaxID=2798577 RepID=A0A7T7XNB5_9SPIR|nr:hypothetical protein [Breznakiella homolactica]QQO09496.1 hypothetical protein JFL75_00830 [Breznakiella homolactica]